MTQQNQRRDQVIEEVGNQVHENLQTLATMTQQNQRRDQVIEEVGNQVHANLQAVSGMTGRNRDGDEAIAMVHDQVHEHLQALKEITQGNARRDEAIAAQAKEAEQCRKELRWQLNATQQQCAALRQQLDDLRRRSVRIPGFVYHPLRRLFGRGRSA